MYNITLISTFHTEMGKCNSDELHKIIQSISPEIIFEELPVRAFDIIYSREFSDEPLEVKCIKKYLQNHNIEHIPVDIDIDERLTNNYSNYIINTFNKYPDYQKLENEQKLSITQDGFAYLNSKKCSESFNEKLIMEKNLMGLVIANDLMFRIYKSFHEEIDKRENAMLHNIYNYGKENQYNQAVFLIGVGHRNSMVQKIAQCENNEELKLNWEFYNYQD